MTFQRSKAALRSLVAMTLSFVNAISFSVANGTFKVGFGGRCIPLGRGSLLGDSFRGLMATYLLVEFLRSVTFESFDTFLRFKMTGVVVGYFCGNIWKNLCVTWPDRQEFSSWPSSSKLFAASSASLLLVVGRGPSALILCDKINYWRKAVSSWDCCSASHLTSFWSSINVRMS